MYRITFCRENKWADLPEGATVLEAEILAGLTPDAPCGGQGTCGKCLVRIDGELQQACQRRIDRDLTVETLGSAAGPVILEAGFSRPVAWRPSLSVHKVTLEKAKPGDVSSEWDRLLESLERAGGPAPSRVRPDPALASRLYECRLVRREWYVIHTEEEILDLRPGEGRRLLAAFDIGTTTVVGYLLDGQDGRELAVESCLNPQVQYGADVIQRASYALAHGTEILSGCIRDAVNGMLQSLSRTARTDPEDIFQVSVVGNPCMHHLFLGISPGCLVNAPYLPAIRQRLTLKAVDYGLDVHPRAQLILLPNIAGYVGADTCGCLLAVRPDQKEEISLLLDIGTNGEMVLGNRDRLIACSTAAGPAFEGAKIECGMRGAPGAVDHVWFREGEWQYSTVEHAPARGLCGSGLIDLTAELLRTGKIDEGGCLESGQEDPHKFLLAPGEEGGVYLTQRDIREVQLAKAAIAAGIRLMRKALGIPEEEIRTVYIAGAFGNYLDPASAAAIGMIPASLAGRVIPVGNAAGEGAKLALANQEELRQVEELAQRIEFMELAVSPDFQDCFVDELAFPEQGV